MEFKLYYNSTPGSRKYHSGIMCCGVEYGLAGIKLSGCEVLS